MNTLELILFCIAILVVIIILLMYLWYNYMGWQPFTVSSGTNNTWTSDTGNIKDLRFKDCTFTIDGQQYDVTPALNAMSTAYKGAELVVPTLSLTAPLNPMSFTIKGVNDSLAASQVDQFMAYSCSLVGLSRTI